MSGQLPRSLRRARNLSGLALATAAIALGPAAITHAQAASGVSANFDATLGILNIVGDDTSNSITVARGPNSTIIINGGSVLIDGGTPRLNNTVLIQVFGNGGNDEIDLSDLSAPQLNANLFGGPGNDTLKAARAPRSSKVATTSTPSSSKAPAAPRATRPL